jgi:hypothetical protein
MTDILFFPFLVLFWVSAKMFDTFIGYWWILIIIGLCIYLQHLKGNE